MLKNVLLGGLFMLGIHTGFSQTTFLPLGSVDYDLLDRLETRSGRPCDSISVADKPESRRNAVGFLEYIKADQHNEMSGIDRYNLEQMISENGEWAPPAKTGKLINYVTEEYTPDGALPAKHPWFNTFYKTPYDFIHVNTKDFFLVINPVTDNMVTEQHNTPQPSSIKNTLFYSSRGAELRGWISKKLGFYTYVTDNQEQFPYFVYNYASKAQQSVPGADYFTPPGANIASKGYYDYLQASGYINFDAVKDHVNLTFGNGKHFIGDGITSLFLTDFSSNMPYLQVQARIWKLNYECLYLELTPQYDKNLGDTLLTHKYSTIHYLTWNAARWLTLGFFEAEVFDRPNVYEVAYLNPIIFSTAINRFNGNGDKSILGMSGKIIAAKHLQFYGQLLLNEFRYSEFFGNNGWYGNKWGVQAGAKYFDAFTVKDLDLQAELDAVRPYTYTAKDTLANYTNYNQPLADPLGAGFVKAIGQIKYQPVKNLYLTLKATYYVQGVDTGNINNGDNIFDPYVTAENQYGVKLINGPKAHCEILDLNISYQLRRNLFLDLGGAYRKYTNNGGIYNDATTSTGAVPSGGLTTNYVYFGFRINAPRRNYEFF
jgi:hypothetical protein